MKLCDRCRVAGCLLDCGGEACRSARRRDCPDVVFTKADKIREMNDEALAVMFAKLGTDPARLDRRVQQYRGEDVNKNFAWLEEPAEAL